MSDTAQIVHESETQRQYIRLQLPASVEINDDRFSLKDLSAGGFALRDITVKDFKKGKTIDLKLILPFSDFAIDINLKAEVQYTDKKLKIAGCRFVDLTPSQISILNHVIRSFMAGDIENNTDIISVVARDNFANIRKHQKDQETSKSELIKRYSLYGLTLFAIIAVSSFIIGNMMQKIFVVHTAEAYVSLETINMSAPLSGTFVTTLPDGVKTVEKNTPLAKIVNAETNDSLVIYSPCDCYIIKTNTLNGQYTPKDQTLFELIKNDETAVILATLDLKNAHRLKEGKEASIQITGIDTKIKGSVAEITLQENSSTLLSPKATIKIKPSSEIPIDLINRLAYVEFHL